MFLQRNVAGQTFVIPGTLRVIADGSAVTTGATLTWVKDGTSGASAGTLTHISDGGFSYQPTAGETDAKICGWVLTKTGAAGICGSVRTTNADPNDATALGLSMMPANVKQINAVATTSVTTVNANIGATQPINFTGTGASALVKGDAVDIAGTAQTARDIGASVLLSAGTGTGQIALTSGAVTVGTNNDKTGYRTAYEIRNGTAQAGTASSITLDSGASASDNFYNGCWVVLTGGTGAGQAREINPYVGATRVATVVPNWTTAPDATSVFTILPAACVSVDWSNVQSQSAAVNLANTSISTSQQVQSVSGSVGSIASNGISNGSFAANAISSSVLATSAKTAIATAIWQDATAGDFTVASSIGKALYINNVAPGASGGLQTTNVAVTLPSIPANWITAAGINAAALNGKGDWLLASSYTAPTNLTAAQIATGVWQDTTAGDFTVAASIGKSLFTSGNVPGAASGLALVGSNVGAAASVTGNVGGNVVGSVGSVVSGVTLAASQHVIADSATLAASQPNYAPAKAGDKMDLVDAPNTTAVGVIQSGLATATGLTTFQSKFFPISGTVTSSPTTTSFVSNIGAAGFDQLVLVWRSGAANYPFAPRFVNYNASTHTITPYTAWDSAPVIGDAFDILNSPYKLGVMVTATDSSGKVSLADGAIHQSIVGANTFLASQFTSGFLNNFYGYAMLTDAAVTSATANTITLSGTTTSGTVSMVDGDYVGCQVFITGGTGSSPAQGPRTCTAYVGATKTMTFDANWTATPNNTSTVHVHPVRQAKLDSTLNVSGTISGNVTVGGYATGQDPATLVLDTLASGHNTAGTIGAKINSAASAGDPLQNAVPGTYAAGTAGFALGNLNTPKAITIVTRPVTITEQS